MRFSQRNFCLNGAKKRSESHCLPSEKLNAPVHLLMRLVDFARKMVSAAIKSERFAPRTMAALLAATRAARLSASVCFSHLLCLRGRRDVGAANPYAPRSAARINIGTQQPSGVAASQNIILSNLMHLLLPQTNQPTICHPNAAVIEFYLTRAPPTSFSCAEKPRYGAFA